ncbi:hypothetical protein [Shimia biformata]|uniref:hypothetical protein n=1 Tax=Shimia biformata TaxID=1294299 RepID=UPI001950E350|nr:hypothetical protein [Shimia biformata]
MFGVVLWSDNLDNKAVIWCEDHGDLAFFNGGNDMPSSLPDLDPGDLVQFELSQDRNLRYARNPVRVAEGAYDTLPDTLSAQHNAVRVKPRRPVPDMSEASILPFPKQRDRMRDLVAV